MNHLISIAGLIAGIWFLVKSSDWFVDGAAGLARHWKMPPLLIGMVVVGFGTSVPEMTVSALASLDGAPLIALGNAYGSNIANIGLILGLAALVAPIAVHRQALWREMPVLMGVTALTCFFLRDGGFSRFEGIVLLAVFAVLLALMIRSAMKKPHESKEEETVPFKKSVWLTAGGLAVLIASSRLLVWSAIRIAQALGVNELIIGLTVVAVGTSLPELMSTLAAQRKGSDDLALGNIVGSNFFNTLVVAGLAMTIHPAENLPAALVLRDIGVMSGLTVLLFAVALFDRYRRGARHGLIGRVAGGMMLAIYIAYTARLIFA